MAKTRKKIPKKTPGAKLNAGKVTAINNPAIIARIERPQNEFECLSQVKVVFVITI